MVVETLFMLFSDELTEIQQAGTRILTCIEPVDLLARMFPTDELKRRTDAAVEALAAARTLRFTNGAGTDVTYRIGYPVKAQYGYVDQPGQWDHWPSGGMVLTCGEDDGIDGRVVVDRGDILLPFKQYVVEPIEFVIEAGRITEIRGDGYQAELVRTYIADFDDPDAYGLSHIGWGLDERAKWAALATDSRGHGMELRAFCGNVLFSTGPNDLVGGPNHTPLPPRHPDAELLACSSTSGRSSSTARSWSTRCGRPAHRSRSSPAASGQGDGGSSSVEHVRADPTNRWCRRNEREPGAPGSAGAPDRAGLGGDVAGPEDRVAGRVHRAGVRRGKRAGRAGDRERPHAPGCR